MKRNTCLCIAAVMALVLLPAGSARAVLVGVPNFSFESPTTPAFPIPPTSWNNTGTAGSAIGTAHGFAAFDSPATKPEDGVRYAFFNTFNLNDSASLTSDAIPDADPFSAATTIAANTTYKLTVAVGLRSNASNSSDDYLIELLSNGTPFASAQLLNAFSVLTPGTFEDLVASVTTPAAGGPVGGVLSIRLTHTNTNDFADMQGQMDNVRLDATLSAPPSVPEPATFALLGICGLAAMRRRRHPLA